MHCATNTTMLMWDHGSRRASMHATRSVFLSACQHMCECGVAAQAAAAVAVGAPRDPQRLTQPTKSTASRVEARRTTGTIARDSGYVRHISRRTASLSGSR